MKQSLKIILLVFGFFLFLSPSIASAKDLPTITVVNPIRGNELGHENEDLLPGLTAQWQVTRDHNVSATWLWQFSALENKKLTDFAKSEMKNQEFGLFLEIDRNFANASHVQYRGRGPWYFSDGLLLISYDANEREKLIDTQFAKFRQVFGYYPKTVGSWWVGADSLVYMQKKYGITASLKAADQYNLDVYTIWGTPWNIPYLASRENEGIPAKSYDESAKVVIAQWAARDPLQGYGPSGDFGTFSTQDYELKGYDISYFDYLLSLYVKKPLDQIIIGLENTQPLAFAENSHYSKLLQEVVRLRDSGIVQIVPEQEYANEFLHQKIVLAPTHTILSKDFQTDDQSFWYTSPNYRVFIRKKGDSVSMSDLRNFAQKTPEAFSLLPNSQGNLRVNTPSLIDSASFPQQEKRLAVSSNPLRITEKNNELLLYSGDKKLATFSRDSLRLENDKTFVFKPTPFSLSSFWLLFSIFSIYIVILFIIKRDKKQLLQNLLLFVPLFIAYPFFQNTPILFDKKQLFLSPLFAILPFSLTTNVVIFQLFPFLLLLVAHFILTVLYQRKYVYFAFFMLVTLLFLHLPYFPLDRSTYNMLGIIIGAGILFAAALDAVLYLKTRSKKLALLFAAAMVFLCLLFFTATVISRSKEILTPFELDALQIISANKKDVVYLFPTDIPIYKAIRPVLFDDLSFAKNITHQKWQKIQRGQLSTTKYSDKILFVSRYLGSDIYPEEIEKYNLTKIFENQQIALFEEK